jgi:DNA primase small subunit
MEARTRAYLRGRFGDHYRGTELTLPPAAHEREWGYIPWTEDPGTTMVRHRSLLDLGNLGKFLKRERPRHVYFSAGKYEAPGASSMGEKNWTGSDLVFDLDADHLPSVELGVDSYAQMLAKCKDELLQLLDFLERDFAFEDMTIVFSGGRGYHVHVRDPSIQHLEREGRREVVDYIRGTGLDTDHLVTTEMRGGVSSRVLQTGGGWGRRTHERVMDFVDELRELDDDEAMAQLQELDGIGEGRAKTIYGAIQNSYESLAAGNVEAGGVGIRTLVETIANETAARENAAIDEPVTTDTNRLIRLPGSLHGGSGLAVRRLERDDVADFDPLDDAIPETFRGHEINIEVTDGGEVELGGDSFTLTEAEHTVPEYVGVFLMARGRAEKGTEQR